MKILSTRSKLFITLLICMALLVGIGFTILNQNKALAVSTVVQQVSSDPFTNDTSQHQTQVQGGTLSHGTTVVSTFQSGRFQSGGGSSGISWATSLESGLTWNQGTLQGITTYADPGGSTA